MLISETLILIWGGIAALALVLVVFLIIRDSNRRLEELRQLAEQGEHIRDAFESETEETPFGRVPRR